MLRRTASGSRVAAALAAQSLPRNHRCLSTATRAGMTRYKDFLSTYTPPPDADLEALRAQGLIRGGSLENALVCDAATGWLNPSGTRYANEPARHKLLDLMGDLALLPGHALPCCHVVAFKAGHRIHVALGRALLAAAADG